jgi:3-oxoadipate enol-lactonase
MAWAEVNGIRMFYETHGDGDDVVVFAHGAGGNHLSWWQQVPAFRERYRCIVIDHRGFGQSLEPDGGPGSNAFSADLEGLLDHLGISRAFLVAQSMGGGTCMGFAAAWPERVRGLVMADTMLGMQDDGIASRLKAFRDAQAGPMTLQGRAYAPALKTSRPEMAFLYDSVMALNPPRTQPTAEREMRFTATKEKLSAMNVPMLFIAGEIDAIFPADILEYASTLVPGAQFAKAPGCGHSVYFEDAPWFNDTVGRFLDQLK